MNLIGQYFLVGSPGKGRPRVTMPECWYQPECSFTDPQRAWCCDLMVSAPDWECLNLWFNNPERVKGES